MSPVVDKIVGVTLIGPPIVVALLGFLYHPEPGLRGQSRAYQIGLQISQAVCLLYGLMLLFLFG